MPHGIRCVNICPFTGHTRNRDLQTGWANLLWSKMQFILSYTSGHVCIIIKMNLMALGDSWRLRLPWHEWGDAICLRCMLGHGGLMQADAIRVDPQLSVLLRRGARFLATSSASASRLLRDLMCKTNICIPYIVLWNWRNAAFGNVWVSAEAQWEMQANDPNPLSLAFLICIWFCLVTPVALAG